MEHLLSAKDAYNSYVQTCTRLQIIHKDDQLLLDNVQSVRIHMFSINMMLDFIVNFLITYLPYNSQSNQLK